jgi:hypothetical protein
MKTNRHLNGPNVDVVPLLSVPLNIMEIIQKSLKQSEYQLLAVYRVQNVDLWSNYARQAILQLPYVVVLTKSKYMYFIHHREAVE